MTDEQLEQIIPELFNSSLIKEKFPWFKEAKIIGVKQVEESKFNPFNPFNPITENKLNVYVTLYVDDVVRFDSDRFVDLMQEFDDALEFIGYGSTRNHVKVMAVFTPKGGMKIE